ncbi:MAG: DNA repair protein RecO [Bacillota bacterium]
MGYNENMIVRGICLRATNYKEKDKILTLATLEKGKTSLVARGVRNPAAKLKAGCMPLVFGEFSISQGRGTPILTGVEVEENFHNCWTDTDKNLASLAVLELLEKSAVENQDISREIVYALKSLKEINYSAVFPYASTVWFILKVIRHIGVDYTIEELPKDVRQALNDIASADIDEVETLEIMPKSVITSLYYLNLIIKNQLLIKISILDYINKQNQ